MDLSSVSQSHEKKHHAVCCPAPFQSHINAMLKLAKLLHHRGFFISFVNTEFNHARLVKARGPNFMHDLPPDFQFLTIPDGVPPSNPDGIQDIPSLCESMRNYMWEPFSELINNINVKASSVVHHSDDAQSNINFTNDNNVVIVPEVSCIVSDGFMCFCCSRVAEKFEIPLVKLWTISASSLMALNQYRRLQERGLTPPKDNYEGNLKSGLLDTPIDIVPGMKNMRIRDMPTFHAIDDPKDTILNFDVDNPERMGIATATIIHTYEALESDVLSVFSSMHPNVFSIGPFQLLLNEITQDKLSDLKHIRSNLLEEDIECLQWLDTREPQSVLYINFGSIAFLTPQQLVEFAIGIRDSQQAFLWVIRSDLVKGENAILPPEFVEETKDRGFFSGWCPQEEVLNHPSIAGFLTHCGWNSIIESISAGVPMLCWPCFVDQKTNCRYVCCEWEIGLEICSDVKRDEVERLVRELMEGQKGKELKNKAMGWMRLTKEAIGSHGSSFKNLDKLVHEILT